ncbi:hypothetical protein GCM10027612_08180 [Microbispora bryophytorum subsp. camponoti]
MPADRHDLGPLREALEHARPGGDPPAAGLDEHGPVAHPHGAGPTGVDAVRTLQALLRVLVQLFEGHLVDGALVHPQADERLPGCEPADEGHPEYGAQRPGTG